MITRGSLRYRCGQESDNERTWNKILGQSGHSTPWSDTISALKDGEERTLGFLSDLSDFSKCINLNCACADSLPSLTLLFRILPLEENGKIYRPQTIMMKTSLDINLIQTFVKYNLHNHWCSFYISMFYMLIGSVLYHWDGFPGRAPTVSELVGFKMGNVNLCLKRPS